MEAETAGVVRMNPTRSFRLGVDIGGTFTDAVLVEEDTGTIWIDKVLTTPGDPSEGFFRCVRRLAERVGFRLDQLRHVIHATTVATNAVLERRGVETGMLVTQGFRDILEIGRAVRHELYNLQTDKPSPLISRDRCLEIPERLDYRGKVLVPLDEAAVASAAEALRVKQVKSIAICFLHSYQNPAHEQKAAEVIRRLFPEMTVSLSSEMAPEIREYWRASTTVTNAYITPIVENYLDAIEQKLRREGITVGVHIMQSSGGIMTVATAKGRAVYMLESGAAAGVAAGAFFSQLAGFRNAVSFDMGGTTAKMGLILNGQPKIVPEFEVGAALGSGTGLVKASGYPILVPTIDLVEVGAGGGSIAWIDSGGLMRVGPRSAGADPGPACYGKGGTEPTVTDANLLLGRLNPEYFLGGEIRLSVDAARKAIDAFCATPLGIDIMRAAMGIIDIANVTMVEAMRLVSVQRGYDPGEFSLVAFGGAGPVHANRLAQELGIPVVVIPPSPGVASAFGMLVSNLRHDYRLTRLQPLAQARLDDLDRIYRDFEARASAALDGEGVLRDQMTFERYVDMRYIGQLWNLKIRVPEGELRDTDLSGLKESFHQHHEQSYGYCVVEEPVEIVNIGLTATGLVPKPRLKETPRDSHSSDGVRKTSRPVYFHEIEGFLDCPVFDRYALREGNVVAGPAVIEEVDSTTIVHPDSVAEVVPYGVLLLRRV